MECLLTFSIFLEMMSSLCLAWSSTKIAIDVYAKEESKQDDLNIDEKFLLSCSSLNYPNK